MYTWFDKNKLRLYLNGAKIYSIGGGGCGPRPPLNTPIEVFNRPRPGSADNGGPDNARLNFEGPFHQSNGIVCSEVV